VEQDKDENGLVRACLKKTPNPDSSGGSLETIASGSELGIGIIEDDQHLLSSTSAPFYECKTPLFSRLPAVVAGVFANPNGSRGVSKLEIAWFSRLFWLGGLRIGAEVELRRIQGNNSSTVRLSQACFVA
jgi:hypothetical protein